MYPYFDIEGLSAERLLTQWRWLCPQEVKLVAVSPFGDLFLAAPEGAVHRLDVSLAKFERIARSVSEFNEQASDSERLQDWFSEDVAAALFEEGFRPKKGQCLGYKTPIVFKESTGKAENIYIAELYEYVSFLGDMHCQIRNVPDGGKVRLVVGPPPTK